MKIRERMLAALEVAKSTWLFSLMKSGADELGIKESRFDSTEWAEVENALDKIEPATLQNHERVFWDLREYIRAGEQAMADLCWLLECEMATLEYIKDLKKTAKHEVKRHEEIIEKGLVRVRVLKSKGLEVPRDCPRVFEQAEV